MRALVSCALTIGLAGSARAEPLWDADIHLAYSFAPSTFAASGTGSYLFEAEPNLSAYGGFVVEMEPTKDKDKTTAFGSVFGVRLDHGPFRLAGGGAYIFAPKSAWGAQGSLGVCKRMSKTMKLCGDVELTEYLAGTGIMDGTTRTEILLGVGVVISDGE